MAPCPTDDDLELYALARMPESAAAVIEEHLLVCGNCRDRLAGWDEYIAAMRAAMEKFTISATLALPRTRRCTGA